MTDWLAFPTSDQKFSYSNPAYDCMALHYTEPFIIIFPSSRYDLNDVERDVKHQPALMAQLDARPPGDWEVAGSTPAGSAT